MGRSQAMRQGQAIQQSQATQRRQSQRGQSRFGPEGDDSGSPILHVDMDAFYASVEVHRDPSLKGRPVVVGGIGPRGVVSSASYEARTFGVRSAMPTARARALCPGAVFISPDFTAYTAASRAVMGIFRDVTPLVEPLSLDEAFLDVGGARRLLGPPAAIARLVRSRVRDELGLTCSVGVAPTKFVAKLGSTWAKPDGLIVVPADQVLEFLHPLPVAALWGVGERAAETLSRLGLHTVGDVAQAPVGMLRAALGEAASAQLHELSWGRDPRRVEPEQVDKSIGAEVTFDTDVADPAVIRRALLSLSEKTGARLRHSGQVGRTVSIKVRRADFRTVNRSRTLPGPTDVAREVFETAWALWEALRAEGVDPRPDHPASGASASRQGLGRGDRQRGSARDQGFGGGDRRAGRRASTGQQGLGDPIRLVGVRVEGLTRAGATPRQPTLGEPEHGWRDAEAAADAAAARFGRAVVRPASLLRPAGPSSPVQEVGPERS